MDAAEERTARENVAVLLASLGSMRNDEVLGLADGVAKDRDGFERLIDMGVELLRDRLVYLETGDERLLTFPGSIAAEPLPRPRLLADFDLFTESRSLLERRVSAQLVAENLFLKLRGA